MTPLQLDTQAYVDKRSDRMTCAQCQANKINMHTQRAPSYLITIEAEIRPFQTVAMDFITKLPLSDGHDTIPTITDQGCTKMALFIPCSETIMAEGVARLYMHHVFKRFGLPTKIISNRDTHFTSRFTKDLCRHLSITQNISTAYHPRTDGQLECTNQWLEQYLRFWTNHKQNNWTGYLPVAEFAHNTWYNATTKTSPFHLLMGYEPRATWEITKSPLPQITTRMEQMIEARQVAYDVRRTAEAIWERWAHHQRFEEGALVWLEGRNIHTSHPTAKLALKRYGPFPITKVLGPVTYQLRLPEQWSIHLVLHVDLLTPYKETEFHGRNFEQPLPDLIDGEEEYEVECIIDSRRFGHGRQVQYLVHWKGYPESDDQWISWSDLNAPELLAEFKRENPDAVTHIRATQVDEKSSTSSSLLPPTSLPPHLTHFVYMSNASAAPSQGSVQGRGASLRLYEAAAAQVGNDTDGSAIIRRIMALSQAAADDHAAEVREREEANRNRNQGDAVADVSTGANDGGTVLAGVSASSGVVMNTGP